MSNCSELSVPSSKELIAYFPESPSSVILIVFMSFFTAIILVIYLEALSYITGKVQDSRTRVRLKVILAIYPMYACTSLLALFVPRAHLITTLSATLFFSVALFQFMMLVISYFGGRQQLLIKLRDHNIPVASPPLLCCCVCLPPVPVNERSMLWLRRVVMQTAFIRPMCNLVSLILWADGYPAGSFAPNSPFLWLNVVALCSSVLAIFGVIILMRMSDEYLGSYRLKPKFLLVQLVLVLTTVQSIVIGVLALEGAIECSYPLSVGARANYIGDGLVIVEMMVFSVLARFFFRRRIRLTPSGSDHPDHHTKGSDVKQLPVDLKEVRPVNELDNATMNGESSGMKSVHYGNNNSRQEAYVSVGLNGTESNSAPVDSPSFNDDIDLVKNEESTVKYV